MAFKKSFSFPEKPENGLVDEEVSSPVPQETNVSEVHLPGKQRRLFTVISSSPFSQFLGFCKEGSWKENL